jgi:hypothetical protein
MKKMLLALLLLTGCATANTSSDEQPVNALFEPMGSFAYYYARPDSTINEAGSLPAGQPIQIIGRRGRWYRSQYPNQRSYYFLVGSLAASAGFNSSPYNGSRTIQTGPRGGHYYINKNGNKTYIPRK